jgi:acetyl esterase
MKRLIAISVVAVAAATGAFAQGVEDKFRMRSPALETVASFANDRPIAMVVSREGRRFVNLPYSNFSTESHAVSVVEVMADGSVTAFPNAAWNAKDAAAGLSRRFVNVQSLTIDANDILWVLDTGSPRRNGVIPGAAKLVAVDLATSQVVNTVVLNAPVVVVTSYLNDLRVDSGRGFAYVTDSVDGGIIVVNLRTGEARRTLTNLSDEEVRRPAVVEGVALATPTGTPFSLVTDGIAMDAAGEWLYFMYRPLSGSRLVHRIRTEALRDSSLSEAELARRVEIYATGVISDGIEIDREGRIYFTDVERNAVSRIRPGGELEILVSDPRLRWPDALAFDREGNLYVTVAQFHLLPGFNSGSDRSAPPFQVFRLPVFDMSPREPSDTLKADAQALMDRMAAAPRRGMSIPEQRVALAGLQRLTGPAAVVHEVSDRVIPTASSDLKIRIYRPSANALQPVLLWFHSGSWVKGDLDLEDVQLRAIANQSGWTVVSVDYRLAPEHPFPAANEDAVAAARWVADNAATFGGDPSSIAVGGNSAGGALAAHVAQQRGISLLGQVLVHPVLDATLSSGSWVEFGDKNYVVGREEMLFNLSQYVPLSVSRSDPAVSPLFATSLTGQPPTLIITAGVDPIRDDGRAYAARLAKAGVAVEERRYPGTVHGFFLMTGVLEDGRDVLEEVAGWLRHLRNPDH